MFLQEGDQRKLASERLAEEGLMIEQLQLQGAPASGAVFGDLSILTPGRGAGMRIEELRKAFWRATNTLHARHGDGALPPDFPALIGMDEVALLEREDMLQALRLHAAWYSSVMIAA